MPGSGGSRRGQQAGAPGSPEAAPLLPAAGLAGTGAGAGPPSAAGGAGGLGDAEGPGGAAVQTQAGGQPAGLPPAAQPSLRKAGGKRGSGQPGEGGPWVPPRPRASECSCPQSRPWLLPGTPPGPPSTTPTSFLPSKRLREEHSTQARPGAALEPEQPQVRVDLEPRTSQIAAAARPRCGPPPSARGGWVGVSGRVGHSLQRSLPWQLIPTPGPRRGRTLPESPGRKEELGRWVSSRRSVVSEPTPQLPGQHSSCPAWALRGQQGQVPNRGAGDGVTCPRPYRAGGTGV